MRVIIDWAKGLAALVAAFFSGFITGTYREKYKEEKRENNANQKAKNTQNRVVTSVRYRRRVRDKFK